MKTFSMGIGTKVFCGFIVLIIVGFVIGSSGYIGLNRVINAGHLNEAAKEVQTKILEARNYEKNFILRKDDESYQKLTQALDQLASLTAGLKSSMEQSKDADEIAKAQDVYKKAASELKRLEEADALTLRELQEIAKSVGVLAEEESSKAAATIREDLLKDNSEAFKQYALERIKDVVRVGFDVMQYYHDRSMPEEEALNAIRNLHFEGDNYFFVVREDLTLVAHGSNRKLEGQDFGKIQDKKTGKTFMRELVDSALKNGESYTEYFWNKPGMGDAVFPKVTYAKAFKPWGLVICAGAYIEDIEKQVAKTGRIIGEGLGKLQQASAINHYFLQARLYAVYYFAFSQHADQVAENVARLKEIPLATEELKKDADTYLQKFNGRVKNNENRQKDIAQIDEVAGKTAQIATAVSDGALTSFSSIASSGKLIIVSFIVFGVLAGLTFATLLARAIIKPIKRAISGLDDASEQVASASGQVSSSSQHLAEGSSEQAACLEETSSALEQITSVTRQNAENAIQANRLMTESNNIVQKANQTMADLIGSMTEISKASEETQKIIKTIDEIAFQTNLLALNAAVEAARAGEAGAGFAVVADEVRNLAIRAADAAKNTAILIEGTVKKVKEGNHLVQRTNEDFQQVSASVTKSEKLVSEIAAASEEQAQGIGQVNTSVAQMDKVVQQNAANAEESAAAAEEMSAQAVQMKEYVGDLVALVGASYKKGENGNGSERRLGPPPGGGHLHGAPRPQAEARTAAVMERSSSSGKKGNGDLRQVQPEKVVPLSEEDLREF